MYEEDRRILADTLKRERASIKDKNDEISIKRKIEIDRLLTYKDKLENTRIVFYNKLFENQTLTENDIKIRSVLNSFGKNISKTDRSKLDKEIVNFLEQRPVINENGIIKLNNNLLMRQSEIFSKYASGFQQKLVGVNQGLFNDYLIEKNQNGSLVFIPTSKQQYIKNLYDYQISKVKEHLYYNGIDYPEKFIVDNYGKIISYQENLVHTVLEKKTETNFEPENAESDFNEIMIELQEKDSLSFEKNLSVKANIDKIINDQSNNKKKD